MEIKIGVALVNLALYIFVLVVVYQHYKTLRLWQVLARKMEKDLKKLDEQN